MTMKWPQFAPNPMNDLAFAVISCSLDPDSRSYRLADEARTRILAAGHAVTLIDLRKTPLPAFDDSQIYADENLHYLNEVIRKVDGVILAVPVYNWAVGSAAKNAIEATGSNIASLGLRSPWYDKVVTFLVAGGALQSYTAHMSLASSLMLDFKCVINPYHVFAASADWNGDNLSQSALERLEKTLQVAIQLSAALRGRTYGSKWEI